MLAIKKIPPVELRAIIADFNFSPRAKITPFPTSGNIAYLITDKKRTYFLRLSSVGQRWRSRPEVQAEITLLKHLAKKNFPVLLPIKNSAGQEIWHWQNHYGYLRRFITAKEKRQPTLADIKKFGRTLGRLHRLVKNFRPPQKRAHLFDLATTKKHWREDISDFRRSDFPQKEKFIAIMSRELYPLELPTALPRGTIHEDLGKRHVLWHQNKIVAIIDFDRCYFGTLLADLGQACRGWCFSTSWRRWEQKKFQALLTGYQQERPLIRLEKKYLFIAIKFGVLERTLAFGLHFIHGAHRGADAAFAWQSLSPTGLIGELEKNKTAITKFLE